MTKRALACFPHTGRGDIQPQLDSALQDVNDKYLLLEETEKQAVRKALIEERGRFCTFISMLRPVIVRALHFQLALYTDCRGGQQPLQRLARFIFGMNVQSHRD